MMNSDQIVKNEIYYNVSMLISELYADNCDELMEVMSSYDYETAVKEEAGINEINEGPELMRQDSIHDLEPYEWQEIAEMLDIEPHINEALEHWIISDWLAEKLEEHGEMIIYDFKGLTIWGRTTSGQHISMDYVIKKIAEEL